MSKKTWRIKEFGALAHVSVRTLHHYDHIGLLTPSNRRLNGYRVYTYDDLMRLQQILSLKSFGLELSQIQQLLSGQDDIMALLFMQKFLLKEKIQQLTKAQNTLAAVLEACEGKASIDLTSTLKLIEVYNVILDLENSWAAKVFTENQLKKFAEMPKPTKEEMIQYGKDWDVLVAEVKQHVNDDPYGPTGQAYAKKWMDLVQRYWTDHELGIAIWDGYKEGKFDEPVLGRPVMPKNVITWIDKAVYYMYSGQKKKMTKMKQEQVTRPEIKLMGISVRTNNKTEMNPMIGKIFPYIQRYFHEGLAEKMPGRVKPGTTFCCYTAYENAVDPVNGDYTYFIGEEVSSLNNVPEGFATLTIPGQTYAKFTTDPGPMPDVVRGAWGDIWQMTPEKFGGERRFHTDFEIYDERANDPTQQKVVLDVYIGIMAN